jgi:hypothetical protein
LQSFLDVDGSGIDIDVSYSDNMWDDNSVPVIYDSSSAPIPEIEGSLRFTNDQDGVIEPTNVTITFSEEVFLTEVFALSLSVIGYRQEHMVVEAFDANGGSVFASAYGTLTPGLVDLDVDGDAAYDSAGLGYQVHGLYGNAYLEYLSAPVTSISFSLYLSPMGGGEPVFGWSSVGIASIGFTPVPEPGTALLIGLGTIAMAAYRRRGSVPSMAIRS